MAINFSIRLFFSLIGIFSGLNLSAQCQNIPIPDSSFEESSFAPANPLFQTGFWTQNDGAEISGDYALTGDSVLCSYGGGAEQLIAVDSNTTYYLSCFVKNGMNDELLRFILNYNASPLIEVDSNDWTFISQSFNSGSDTIVAIGIYSGQACFDDFKLTCFDLSMTEEYLPGEKPFALYPTISSTHFFLDAKTTISFDLFDMNGKLVETGELSQDINQIGSHFSAGLYVVHVYLNDKTWIEKIVKL